MPDVEASPPCRTFQRLVIEIRVFVTIEGLPRWAENEESEAVVCGQRAFLYNGWAYISNYLLPL